MIKRAKEAAQKIMRYVKTAGGPAAGIVSATLLALVSGCGTSSAPSAGGRAGEAAGGTTKFYVFHAASLSRAFEDLEKEFEARHPGVDVLRESSGSQTAVRKVTELNREGDIIASADYTILRDLMIPDHAKWQILFARNRLVIAYTDKSRYADQINGDNWYRILLKPHVMFGRVNPDTGPVGYRTLQMWQLADLYYKEKIGGKSIYQALLKRCPQDSTRTTSDVEELIGPLESMGLDYAFVYENVAKQHNLPYVTLPEQIDLSNEQYEDFYRKAKVEIIGKKKGERITEVGRPIVYGITVPSDAPHPDLAVEFVKLLLSDEGAKSLEKGFFTPIRPGLTPDIDAVPPSLRPLVKEAKF